MKRLSTATMSELPARIKRPSYNRDAHGVGIVHLGIGAFHRAHQAVYTDDVLGNEGGDWSIIGASLRSKGVHDQLVQQDSLYTVTAFDGEKQQCRVIGSVKDVIFAPEESNRLLELMASPDTRIVTLTVTEKGYYRDPAEGTLLRDDPAIKADLENPDHPQTAIGFIVKALNMRRISNLAPFTVLSCDNLPDNGDALQSIVLEFAALVFPDAVEWIEKNVAFPSSMVDRIVPAMTTDGLASIAAELELRDFGAIITEPFIQWVIEDRFTMGRPAWEKAGAIMVEDVAPFEFMKLRLLNGPHSSLAYLGYLGGMEYVSDCMENPALNAFATKLMFEDIKSTVKAPNGFDIDAYIEDLLARFGNPSLQHRCWQIAMDGSQKLPQRLLGTIRERLQKNLPINRLALAVAGWIQYVSGEDLEGKEIDVSDPLANMLKEKLAPCRGNATAMTKAALQVTDVFGNDLSSNVQFQAAVKDNLSLLLEKGSLSAAEELI